MTNTPSRGPSDRNDLPGGDEVVDRLSRLHVAGPPVPVGGARSARRRANTRQAVWTTGVAAAVLAVMVAVPLSLGSSGEADQRPATPTPAPSVPTDAPTPTDQRPDPDPDPAPSTAATESGESSPPPVPRLTLLATSSGPLLAGDLADLQYEAFRTGDDGDSGGTVTWTLDPCEPTTYPQDTRRTGWASQEFFVGDSGTTQQVATYADEQEAADVVEAFRRVVDACWPGPDEATADLVWREYAESGSTGTAFAGIVRTVAPLGGDTSADLVRTSARTYAVAREGRAVALVQLTNDFFGGTVAAAQGDTRPEAGTPLDDDPAAAVQNELDQARTLATQLAAAAANTAG